MGQAISSEFRAREFLRQANLYQLGFLPTEQSHPWTRNLSSLAQENVPEALSILHKIDLEALGKCLALLPELEALRADIDATLASGGRVFLCGCGATGRLSLTLEYLWRRRHPGSDLVCSFMAGGDVALVHSIEGFEDFPEYGREQLLGLGFGENDLLISSTEGGETPFVIGATEEAAARSRRRPYFLYCNPRDVLVDNVERSRRVLTSPAIRSISLSVGPMALAGSTRMQASTVLMLCIGLCLFKLPKRALVDFVESFSRIDVKQLSDFVHAEAAAYQSGGRLLYQAEDFAITVFTDTTERAPTFSLPPFNNQTFPREDHSLSYTQILSSCSALESWQKLLARDPRVLGWGERNAKTTMDYLLGFDFSRNASKYRLEVLPDYEHLEFAIQNRPTEIAFEFKENLLVVPRQGYSDLFDHLLVKMLLNAHSTLVMGRLGRYIGNIMTWVYPSNGKLIDRAARYTQALLERDGVAEVSYEEVIHEQFRQMESLRSNESIVVKTCEAIKASR